MVDLRESYSSADMESVYSIAPADWVKQAMDDGDEWWEIVWEIHASNTS